jgi:amino acid adenylation domain-containing protein
MAQSSTTITPEGSLELNDVPQARREFSNRCVHELFEAQAARTPDFVALIQGDQQLSYRQLNTRSNQIAHYLRSKGVGPEVLVGLHMRRSLDAVAVILGILKAGGAYVPLDRGYPAQRLGEMVRDSKPMCIMADERSGLPAPLAVLAEQAEAIAAESLENPLPNTEPGNAAYILYTSGSTAKPKGVIGVHGGIANNRTWMEYEPGEVCCLNASLSFAASVTGLFLPLVSGVPLVVLNDEELQDIDRMLLAIERHGVTRIVFVTSVLKKILNLGAPFSSRLRSLKTVGVAGAELTYAVIRSFAELVPRAKLHNGYSSTEIGTLATVCDVGVDAGGSARVPIGRPVWNTSVHILDDEMKPVAEGAVGELYVGAAHLARGYLDSPESTAHRFVPDLFSLEPGRKLFRTGDLGRVRPDGMLELAGRVDDQVKVRGFRITLSEIERHLQDYPMIQDAAAAVRRVGEEERLVGYVVPRPGSELSVSRLREDLAAVVPRFMIPAAFLFLKNLPLLENGKLDRNALPAPEVSRPLLDTAFEEPKTPVEVALAEIWSRLFGISDIGRNDDFLDLGGDSLFAIQLIATIQQALGVDLPFGALFEHPTIAQLAELMPASALAKHNQDPSSSATISV